MIQDLGEGRFLADARVPLWDLGEHLGAQFPDAGDYESLGGFVSHRFGRLPELGARFEWRGFIFTVREADARRVRRVEIQKKPRPSGPPKEGPSQPDAG